MSQQPNAACNMCERLGLRKFTKNNVLFYYAPMHSLLSYAALSVNVMNPALATRLLPKRDVTNFLLIHTVFGTTLYLYNRPHMRSLDGKKKLAYSVLGGALFGFGSVLLWAIIRSAIPKNNALATGVGLASGYAIARLSYDYLEHVDSQAVVQATN